MKNRRSLFHTRRLLVIVTVLICTALVIAYLFRTVTMHVNGEDVFVRYTMGRISELSWDRNNDGLVDLRARVRVSKVGHGRHFIYLCVEEDRDMDGTFDHLYIPAPGNEFVARIDCDQDGHYDKVLHGAKARELYPLPSGPVY